MRCQLQINANALQFQSKTDANSMQFQLKINVVGARKFRLAPKVALWKFDTVSMKIQCQCNANPMQKPCKTNSKVRATPKKLRCNLNWISMQIQCTSNANSMQQQCTFNAILIQVQCKSNANPMQTPYKFNINSMQILGKVNANAIPMQWDRPRSGPTSAISPLRPLRGRSGADARSCWLAAGCLPDGWPACALRLPVR